MLLVVRSSIITLYSLLFLHSSVLIFAVASNFPTPYPDSPVDSNIPANSNLARGDFVHSPPCAPTLKPQKWVLGFGRVNAVATVVTILITILNVIVYKLRQLQESNSGEELILPSSLQSGKLCRCFSLAEILSATNNFDHSLVIGRGGFGKVYKGIIDNGACTVAIKRLDPLSKQGAPEFWTEIEMLSKFRHSHLVSLIGYCENYREMILVYEYMVRGTLADHLHKIGKNGDNSSLSWVDRLKICIGAAHGLNFLHTGTGARHRVIHRDVKSSNILLDENWTAKISDFGMSKIGPANQSCTYISTQVKGTFGYMDPEYFLTRRLTRKSDVYAFGVVLFEVLCGRPAVDPSLQEEQLGLAGWARHCIKEGIVEQIIDPNLRWQILPDSLSVFVHIADRCLHNSPRKRPTMVEVVARLEYALALQERNDFSIVESDINTAGYAFDSQESTDSSIKQEVINVDNDEHHDKRTVTIGHVGRMTFTKKVKLFMSVTARAVSGVVRQVPPSGQIVNNLKMFTFAELKMATCNFRRDMLLSKGGSGSVFAGWVNEKTYAPSKVGVGVPIAVKRLDSYSLDVLKEWQVQLFGTFSHPNLVKLLGYCWEGKKFLIVYEYLCKGSLDDQLFTIAKGAESLSWDTRLKIAVGAAQGLSFLHTTENQVIHRNFKTSKILLDGDFIAKLSGFQLAKLGPADGDTHVSTFVAGTMGYIAPDYAASGHLNAKSDVFSYGMVLLEILTGLQASRLIWSTKELDPVDCSSEVLDTVDWSGVEFGSGWTDKKRTWAERTLSFLSDKRKLVGIIDQRLIHDCPLEGAFQVAALVLKCLQTDPKDRPSMKEVLETLEQIKAIKMKAKDNSEVRATDLTDMKSEANGTGGLVGVPQSVQIVAPNLQKFMFAELKTATRNFIREMLLGNRGVGRFFIGWVNEKTCDPSKAGVALAVAIKKLDRSSLQRFEEWQMEVQLFGTFSHPNLVKLLGYCSEETELLIVYEYMQNGSLDEHLFREGAKPLSWDTRLKIATRTARGLSFLHTLENQIIHRNIKASNILLDGDFNAKLSDFGWARLGPVQGDSHLSTAHVLGTRGYVAPEYMATGRFSAKSDVYSFGVLLLELLTCQRMFDENWGSGEDSEMVFLTNKRELKRLTDRRLEPEGAFQLPAFLLPVPELILKCLEYHPKDRPSMQEVLETLEQISACGQDVTEGELQSHSCGGTSAID